MRLFMSYLGMPVLGRNPCTINLQRGWQGDSPGTGTEAKQRPSC